MHIELKRICVPTDFSEAAEHAVRYGAALAGQFGGELHLLHVLVDPATLAWHPDFSAHNDAAREYFATLQRQAIEQGEAAPAEPPPESAEAAAGRFLHTLECKAQGQLAQIPADNWRDRLPVTRVVRVGNPVQEICAYARRHSIDILVLGTHGRTGLRRMLIGSVAERVVRASPCPVLTVRHPQHQFVIDE